MSEQGSNRSSGILRGLKRILFTDVPAEPAVPEMQIPDVPEAPQNNMEAERPHAAITNVARDQEGEKEMKLKVYQLLENLNSPGVDFFEVWNAAVEMGGVNPQNIRAAFTSLRFADKTLSKEKLLQSADSYIAKLKNIIKQETEKRGEELRAMSVEKQQVIQSLQKEISNLNQQISMLQEKLDGKQQELSNIDQKYDPQTSELKIKIESGQQAVDEVVTEMQQVLSIIQKEI